MDKRYVVEEMPPIVPPQRCEFCGDMCDSTFRDLRTGRLGYDHGACVEHAEKGSRSDAA